MSSLFFDTTNELQIGLLDEKNHWVAFETHKERKASEAIHGLIISLLEKNNLSLKDLKNIFCIAGPGSYTGMRVSSGISQILEWHEFNIISFYHFDVAKILYPEGLWVARAFKDEFYFFEWDKNEEKSFVLSRKESLTFLEKNKKQVYGASSEISELELSLISTSELVNQHSSKVFSVLEKEKLKKELFYYRPLNEEFKKKGES